MTNTIPASTAPITTTLKPEQLAKIKSAAKEFEGVFISQMMSHMFEGIKADDTFGGGNAEDIYRGMMVQEYGKMMSKGNGIGVSGAIEKMMIQMQEQQ